MAVICMAAIGCGTSKRVTTTQEQQQQRNPFGELRAMPTDIYEVDTPEYFAQTGIASGSAAQMGQLQLNALANAREMLQNRLQTAYEGVVSTFTSTFGNNAGSDLQNALTSGVDNVLKGYLGNLGAFKPPHFSLVDDKGNTTCYISIRMSKNELAEKISQKVTDNVSEDEELQIQFRQEEFRKYKDEVLNKFKESNQQ